MQPGHWRIQGGREGRPPVQILSFSCSFQQKKINKHTHFGSWRSPPPGKILDPPLLVTPVKNSESAREIEKDLLSSPGAKEMLRYQR